jgi:hypothetical protein
MSEESNIQTRLCPSCANSINEDAAKCPYCRADFGSGAVPEWLNRRSGSPVARMTAGPRRRFSLPAKLIWPGVLLAAALVAFFLGAYARRSQFSNASQNELKQLQAKDLMIQSQETQLTELRQQLNNATDQLGQMKSQLDESRKELAAARQRLTRAAPRAVNRPTTAGDRPARQAPSRTRSTPVSTAAAGVYETTQQTSVHESPSQASRTLSLLGRGTRINVVGAAGEWLEVRSRYGNPPGFVRSANARRLSRTN